MKLTQFSLFLAMTISPLAFGVTRNLCDDLIEKGQSTPAQIKRCQEKFGESDYSKGREERLKLEEANRKMKADAEAARESEEEKKRTNIEMKKFTYQDLVNEGFGKPFYASKVDYRGGRKEIRITKGDSLCKYLGYEKSVKSMVTPELNPMQQNVDGQGLYIDTTLGYIHKEPDLYQDGDKLFTVRKYEEITCARRVDKTLASDALKDVVEDLIVLSSEINPTPRISGEVNNGPRKPADSGKSDAGKTTPNGYKNPWDDKNGAIQK